MNNTKNIIKAAKTILIPSGRDLSRCVEALRENYGVEVPDFPGRELSVEKGGILFLKVKGKDIPAYIASGYGDIGVTGSDVCEDRYHEYHCLQLEKMGEPICTFELLIPEREFTQVTHRLTDASTPPVHIATHFPRLLQKHINTSLNATISPIQPSGSVEIMPKLGVAEIAADSVASGETAEQNGLMRIWLESIFPTVVYRKAS